MNQLTLVKDSVIVSEPALWSFNGYYVGVKTGTHYSPNDYRHRPQYVALLTGVDAENLTGMFHLDEPPTLVDSCAWHKSLFLGCRVTVEEAHRVGELKVYYCLELAEYFSEHEVNLLCYVIKNDQEYSELVKRYVDIDRHPEPHTPEQTRIYLAISAYDYQQRHLEL
jgi:hypothetical protein